MWRRLGAVCVHCADSGSMGRSWKYNAIWCAIFIKQQQHSRNNLWEYRCTHRMRRRDERYESQMAAQIFFFFFSSQKDIAAACGRNGWMMEKWLYVQRARIRATAAECGAGLENASLIFRIRRYELWCHETAVISLWNYRFVSSNCAAQFIRRSARALCGIKYFRCSNLLLNPNAHMNELIKEIFQKKKRRQHYVLPRLCTGEAIFSLRPFAVAKFERNEKNKLDFVVVARLQCQIAWRWNKKLTVTVDNRRK